MPKDVDFVLSSNPPNPRTSFRLGDWICASPKCAAHNFGYKYPCLIRLPMSHLSSSRNLSCIGCGSQRSPASPTNNPRPALSSPRFSNPAAPAQTPPPHPPSDPAPALQKPSPHHPLLTPSGRAFAVGGKVQNISSDPLNPCIMFWPDNEPFPDQGQIRPSGLVGIPQPPILNTGNRGPISHQPGDWVCQKCNYLNWRRRKVCQTCLPYAEGNGDSISAAVQAERIALLTNVLARTRLDPSGNFQGPILPNSQQQDQIGPALPAQRSQSLTPPTETTALASAPLLEVSPSMAPPAHTTINRLHPTEAVAHTQSVSSNGLNKSVQRSRSHFALGQYQREQHEHYHVQMQRHLTPTPIYQTPMPSSSAPRFAPELINPQHLPILPPQPQHYHHQQAQLHRNPSPLPMPLLYSTGPPASPFMGAALGVPGYRMRVLSSPAPAAPRDWSPNVIASSSPGSGGKSSLGSLDIPHVRIGDPAVGEAVNKPGQTDGNGDNSASGSQLPTPAITSPLLPAFLRDVVSSSSGSNSASTEEKDEEVLGTKFTPRALDGVDLSPKEPVAWVRKSPSTPCDSGLFSLTTKTPNTNHHRARNDSGSSTCSSSSSSSLISLRSSNVSTSGLSLSLSATSISSGSGCCGAGVETGDSPGRRRSGPPAASSPSPTITTTVSSCPTPPADKGSATTGRATAVPTSTSSLPFVSFGNTGIWKMDGEESRSLKGFTAPPPAQSNPSRHGFGAGRQRGPHHLESQAPLLLPVGVEKRY